MDTTHTPPPTSSPRCFMHIPKCAGTSVHMALENAFPEGAVASRRGDTAIFCGFSDFHLLDDGARALVAVGDDEIAPLARYEVVSGHFSLPSLLRLTAPSGIATVLREPRARSISAFMFLRLTSIVGFWGPYGREVLARGAESLERCLSDEAVARSTDNQICRLLLHGDPRLPDGRFVAPELSEEVASAAVAQLDRLGYVGVLEVDDIWADLSAFFDRPLERTVANVSGEGDTPPDGLPIPPFDTKRVLELLRRRNMADQLVYETIVARRVGGDRDEAARIAEAAFARELVRLGDMTGSSATRLHELRVREGDAA